MVRVLRRVDVPAPQFTRFSLALWLAATLCLTVPMVQASWSALSDDAYLLSGALDALDKVLLDDPNTGLEFDLNLLASYLVPVGSIHPFGGSTAPPLFLLCDGRSLSRVAYPALFSVLGTTYGSGSDTSTFTTFALPNLSGRVTLGAGLQPNVATATTHPLGSSGGEEFHTLLPSELPDHTHALTGDSHVHGLYEPGGSQHHGSVIPIQTGGCCDSAGCQPYATPDTSSADHGNIWAGVGSQGVTGDTSHQVPQAASAAATMNVRNEGGLPRATAGSPAKPHNNLAPFAVVTYIIKVQ